jgi:hypothetical protein
MPLSLPEPVLAILSQVEEKFHKTIQYCEKSDLAVAAKIQLADKDSPSHVLYYNATHGEKICYAIVCQCGHILRLFDADQENRYIPVVNKRTMMSYFLEMDDEIHRLAAFFGKGKINQLATIWYEGVVYQLTRMPTEIMINKWIGERYPSLREQQIKGINEQRDVAVMSISESVRAIMPSKIYGTSNIMNYVYFKVLEDYYHLDLVAPYHRTVFIFEGSSLARITENEYIDSHEGDRAMIDRWAGRLGLGSWFEWKPFAGETCLF